MGHFTFHREKIYNGLFLKFKFKSVCRIHFIPGVVFKFVCDCVCMREVSGELKISMTDRSRCVTSRCVRHVMQILSRLSWVFSELPSVFIVSICAGPDPLSISCFYFSPPPPPHKKNMFIFCISFLAPRDWQALTVCWVCMSLKMK